MVYCMTSVFYALAQGNLEATLALAQPDRVIAAEKAHTPSRILEALAEDESFYVRIRVALNPNTPVKALRALARNPETLYGVARNPSTPRDILVSCVEGKESTRVQLAKNTEVPLDLLEQLVKDESHNVRFAVMESDRSSADMAKIAYYLEVEHDTLTEGFAVMVLSKGIKISSTELSALVALFGPKVAEAVFNHSDFSRGSILARQLQEYGFAKSENVPQR